MTPLKGVLPAVMLALIALLLGGCKGNVLPGADATAAGGQLQPRIVAQFGHAEQVVAVRWINGGNNLVSLGLDGSIVVWDVAHAVILDTAQVPSEFPDGEEVYLELRAADVTPDGKSMKLAYARGPMANGDDDGACPQTARAGGERWCSFEVDLASRVVMPDPTFAPDLAVDKQMDNAAAFPTSPDGKWQPAPREFGTARRTIGELFAPAGQVIGAPRGQACDDGVTDPSGRPCLIARDAGSGVMRSAIREQPSSRSAGADPQDTLASRFGAEPLRAGELFTAAPPSHGGCESLTQCVYGVELKAQGGGPSLYLTSEQRGFQDVDITPDGQKLVKVETSDGDGTSGISVFDLGGTAPAAVISLENAYHRVRWIDATHFLAQSAGYHRSNVLAVDRGVPSAIVGDRACVEAFGQCRLVPPRTFLLASDDRGGLIGLGDPEGCFRGLTPDDLDCVASSGRDVTYQPAAQGISALSPGSGWTMLGQLVDGDAVVTAMALSQDKTKLAVATRLWESAGTLEDRQILRVLLFDFADGRLAGPPVELTRIVDPIYRTAAGFENARSIEAADRAGLQAKLDDGELSFYDSDTIQKIAFTPDGAWVYFPQATNNLIDASLRLIETGGAHRVVQVPATSRAFAAIGPTRIVDLERRDVIETITGRRVAKLAGRTAFVRAGYIERSRLIWAASQAGSVEFFDADTVAPAFTLHLLTGGGFFAVAPDGRYDTNLPPDTRAVRWMVPDAPFQSLEPQTFMRDYYEPGLYARLLACRAAGNCGQAFKPLPSLAQVNRVLPRVSFVSAMPTIDGHAVTVTIDVTEGRDDAAANGKTRSGIYNPRLFMNGQLAAMVGSPSDVPDDTIAAWRKANGVGGKRRFVWTVPVATNGGGVRLEFEAYAFNEDRIKSETVRGGLTIVSHTARPRRAYVLAIGIDDYTEARFRLHYAFADAQAMGERLSHIPDREVRTLVLGGKVNAGGRRSVVSRMTIANALGLLDRRRNRAALLAALRRDGLDGSAIEPATPDDLVIVSYSGHGWADMMGNFHLVPSDGGWTAGGTPNVRRLFSSADFVRAILPIEAGRMALIIDACHSSASVANGRFKPGPMGDSGLGQLAWDKNLLVLAATQADDVAREDARLGQGLLTYALAREGLAPGNPKADSNADGEVSLDEWLGYALVRLPELSGSRGNPAPVGGPRGLQFSDGPAGPPPVRVQLPSLFDFHQVGAGVYLMRSRR